MKKLVMLVWAVVLVSVFATRALTLEDKSVIEGKIKDVSLVAITVTKGDILNPYDLRIKVNSDTEFTKSSSLRMLKKGDAVRVEFRIEGDQNIALSVEKVKPGEAS